MKNVLNMNNFQPIKIKSEPNLIENEARENLSTDDDRGSRCGEIYVGNNAKKWTFICTFCDKSMAKIEEFISHIKYAHINPPRPVPAESNISAANRYQNTPRTQQSTSVKHAVPKFSTIDKQMNEYVDYNDFLDVNVQTVPEVILSESNNHQYQAPSTAANEPTAVGRTRIKIEPGSEGEHIKSEPRAKPPTLDRSPPCTIIPGMLSSPHTTLQVAKVRAQKKSHTPQTKQVKGPVFCSICKRTFRYYSLYRNHMVKHSSETPFQCTTCKRNFKSKQAIRYHMTTHQRQKNHVCDICTASFHHLWQLVTHIQTHRSENQHPCELCGKITSTLTEKEAHMRSHAGDRPFACEFCWKRFGQRHNLTNHLKLHRTYRCDYCHNQFSNAVSMKKPYYCPKCAVLYKPANEQSDDEITDITFSPVRPTRDPEARKPHTCHICNRTYVNKRGLSVHITTKH